MMQMKWIVTVMLCLGVASAIAQPKKEVRTGNKLYEEGKYEEASTAYEQALSKQPNYTPGLFNLGNSKYKLEDYEGARKIMDATAKTVTEKETQAAANYNIGNTYLKEKKYKEAVEAYKEALRKNPQDENAKYNLSYALEMLKNQQGGGENDKNKDKKDDENKKDKDKDKQEQNKDKNKDEQDKDKQDQQDKQDNKDEQNKEQDQQQQNEQDNKDEKEKRPQSQPSKLSEQQAEQLLKALQQEEKKLQDKMKKGKGVPVRVEKDW